jgi:hypothetical protein
MSIRATTTHVDKYGVTHRIDLLKDGYVGASTELRGTSSFIGFNHDNLNEDVVFRTPVMSGRLDASLWVDSSAGRLHDGVVPGWHLVLAWHCRA